MDWIETHLVAGAQGQGPGERAGSDRERTSALVEELAEATRLVAASRLRLEALADRLAELRRQVGGAGSIAGK